MTKKDKHQGEEHNKVENRKGRKSRAPAPQCNEILRQRHKEECSQPHPRDSKTDGHAPLSFKPLGEQRRVCGNGHGSNADRNDPSEENIELQEAPDIAAERQAAAHDYYTGNYDAPRSEPIDEPSRERRQHKVDDIGNRLNPGCSTSTPTELIEKSRIKYRKRSADACPRGHAEKTKGDDDPAIEKGQGRKTFFRQIDSLLGPFTAFYRR